MSSLSQFHVHLLPSLIPPGVLRGGVAVVIDVLRATTVMVQALASGCEAIIPCLEIDDARRAADALPPETALLGGERQGLPIAGFHLGNSPGDYTPERCEGKTLVMTTTNGTKAILACLEAERVLVASFANSSATLHAINHDIASHRPIHIVCAGTEGQISLEDTMLAGSLISALLGSKEQIDRRGLATWTHCNDQSLIAAAAAMSLGEIARRSDPPSLDSARRLMLASGKGGRRVAELGLAADIDAAAGQKEINLVAELARDPIRILRTA